MPGIAQSYSNYETHDAGTRPIMRAHAAAEAGFTLIEVMLATALFAFVAFAGLETLRQFGWNVNLLAQRADAAAALDVAAASLRSDALSAIAIWKPPSTCGDAVEFLKRDASGTSFLLYLVRGSALARTSGAGPIDPCDPALPLQTLVANVRALRVAALSASALADHTDPVTGANDGGLLIPGGITAVAVDAHVADIDGSPILAGNGVAEVTIDADPMQTTLDLTAGTKPSGYTQTLAFACSGRCEANTPFPELRGAAFTDCAPGYDFANTPAYYVPASYATVATSGGGSRIVIASYRIAGGYTFTFAGPAPATLERTWPLAVWPPAGSALAGTIRDAYPLDYSANSVAARGVARLATDLGEPATFGAELTACADMHADVYFHE